MRPAGSVLALLLLQAVSGITVASEVMSMTKFSTSSCNDRQTPGIICMSCDTLAVCVQLNNVWETIPVESCDGDAGLFCNEFEGACSTSVGSCNPVGQEGNFECNTVGVFPDPYNCRMYHLCFLNGNQLIAINMDCGPGAAFSPATGDCSLPGNSTVCTGLQFSCDYTGQMASWPGNDNIFYICASRTVSGVRVLFPRLYRCPTNQIFSGGNCVQRDWSQLPPGQEVPYQCDRPGLFPDPLSCLSYFACDNHLMAQHIRCPNGSFFSRETLSCVLGSC